MKRYIAVIAIAVGLVLTMGLTIDNLYKGDAGKPGSLSTPMVPWFEIGTLSVQQAYPAVNALDYTSVAALASTNCVIWHVNNQVSGAQIAFQTTTNADSHVVQVFGFKNKKMLNDSGTWQDDRAVYLGQLTLTGGQQVGPNSNVFVDTIAAVNGIVTWEVKDTGNDRICVATTDLRGFKEVCFVASTLHAGKTIYVQASTY